MLGLHPGVHFDQVHQVTGFKLAVKEPLATSTPPTEGELSIQRVGPHRYVISRDG